MSRGIPKISFQFMILANESPLYLRRKKLSMQYYLKHSTTSQNPAYSANLNFSSTINPTRSLRHANKQSLCRQRISQKTLQTASHTLIESIRVYSASRTASGLKFVDLEWNTKLQTKFAKLR